METQQTELGFLMDLFLDDEVPKPIRKKIAERIKEVESYFGPKFTSHGSSFVPRGTMDITETTMVNMQAPSMQRIMHSNPDLVPKPPMPVTPAAAEALQKRQEVLMGAGNEKPEKGRTSPRKF